MASIVRPTCTQEHSKYTFAWKYDKDSGETFLFCSHKTCVFFTILQVPALIGLICQIIPPKKNCTKS